LSGEIIEKFVKNIWVEWICRGVNIG